MPFHKYCLLSQANEQTIEDMANDIEENGLIESIPYEGKIHEGHNRYLACLEAGVESHHREYQDDEPPQLFITKNNYPCYPNETQRALIGREIYEKSKIGTVSKMTLGQVSEIVNVSRRQIQKAKCLDHASTTLKQAATEGTVSLHKIAGIVEKSAAITGINSSTKNTAERKRLHEVQDKILSLEE